MDAVVLLGCAHLCTEQHQGAADVPAGGFCGYREGRCQHKIVGGGTETAWCLFCARYHARCFYIIPLEVVGTVF